MMIAMNQISQQDLVAAAVLCVDFDLCLEELRHVVQKSSFSQDLIFLNIDDYSITPTLQKSIKITF
jgi:hypothetical protein